MTLRPGKYLFDTNVIINLQKQGPLHERLDPQSSYFIPVTALAELYYGAEKSAQRERNFAAIEDVLEVFRVLPADGGTALQYGLVRNALEKAGRPIPYNDIWIAATALQHGLVLLSDDIHFNVVAELFPQFNKTVL